MSPLPRAEAGSYITCTSKGGPNHPVAMDHRHSSIGFRDSARSGNTAISREPGSVRGAAAVAPIAATAQPDRIGDKLESSVAAAVRCEDDRPATPESCRSPQPPGTEDYSYGSA